MIRCITALIFFINTATTSVAQIAPDFTFTDINGVTHNLQHALDQNYIVLVEMFFSDCGPCITAAEELQDIHEDYAGKNVLVWAISDIDDDERILQFHEDMGLTFASGGTEGGGIEVFDLLCENNDFIAYPTVSIICPDGSLTWDIYPYSLGAPEWRMAIDKCGVEDAYPYEPFGSVTAEISHDIQKTELKISPNPANDFINIQLAEGDDARIIEVEIYDATGRFLKKIIRHPVKSIGLNLTIDTSDLEDGFYYLKMGKEGGVEGISRFVKVTESY